MIESISTYFLPVVILVFFIVALCKKVPIYEEFVEGAKDGFKYSVTIIPYLVAIIVAVSMFRASGAMDYVILYLATWLEKFSLNADIIPIMMTRSLSGAATLGLFSEIATKNGADSFITQTAAIMVGSSETTFYVLSVYFGAVGIKKFRYAILTGIIADIIGIVLAILVARMFFLASTGL